MYLRATRPSSTNESRSTATKFSAACRLELSEEEFRSLRLQNGLYLQRHACMHRVAISYGNLRSDRLRMLARIARERDRGYGHFSTPTSRSPREVDSGRPGDPAALHMLTIGLQVPM